MIWGSFQLLMKHTRCESAVNPGIDHNFSKTNLTCHYITFAQIEFDINKNTTNIEKEEICKKVTSKKLKTSLGILTGMNYTK